MLWMLKMMKMMKWSLWMMTKSLWMMTKQTQLAKITVLCVSVDDLNCGDYRNQLLTLIACNQSLCC